MATDTAQPKDADKTSERDAAFENKHEKELGFKRFAYIQSLYLFVPAIAGIVGGLIGFKTLGRPLTRLFPKAFGFAGNAESVAKNFKNVLNPERLAKAMELAAQGKPEKEIMAVMGMKPNEVSESAKLAGAYALGAPAAITGAIAVGYDKWRKDESSRLAADEINRDIANLELFKPSNPEIIAENKRLRAMLADAPIVSASGAKHEGKITAEPEQQIA